VFSRVFLSTIFLLFVICEYLLSNCFYTIEHYDDYIIRPITPLIKHLLDILLFIFLLCILSFDSLGLGGGSYFKIILFLLLFYFVFFYVPSPTYPLLFKIYIYIFICTLYLLYIFNYLTVPF